MTYVFKTGPMYKSANQDDSIQFYYGIEFHFVDLLIWYIVFPKHAFCHRFPVNYNLFHKMNKMQ